MKKTFLISLLIIILIGCEKETPFVEKPNKEDPKVVETLTPESSFIFEPLEPFVNQTITFTSTGKNVTFNKWQFDNDVVETTQSRIERKFSSKGLHNVTLTVYNANKSKSNSISKTINVKALPTKIVIKQIRILAISWQDTNGRYWDDNANDGPDIFIKYSDGKNTYNPDTYIKDVTKSMLPLNIDYGRTLTPLSSTYTFRMYDYDTWVDDWMADFVFKPNSNIYSNYPKEIDLTTGVYKIKLIVEWLE